ncbi:hypothetical protein SBDP2_770016 [Syntrophobacter sp. SbD2]|nr:hypothetical protein SBDP2_770016 [Syntrophobacter sp. SbD2]
MERRRSCDPSTTYQIIFPKMYHLIFHLTVIGLGTQGMKNRKGKEAINCEDCGMS